MFNRRFEPIKILIILLFLELYLNSKSPIKKGFFVVYIEDRNQFIILESTSLNFTMQLVMRCLNLFESGGV